MDDLRTNGRRHTWTIGPIASAADSLMADAKIHYTVKQ